MCSQQAGNDLAPKRLTVEFVQNVERTASGARPERIPHQAEQPALVDPHRQDHRLFHRSRHRTVASALQVESKRLVHVLRPPVAAPWCRKSWVQLVEAMPLVLNDVASMATVTDESFSGRAATHAQQTVNARWTTFTLVSPPRRVADAALLPSPSARGAESTIARHPRPSDRYSSPLSPAAGGATTHLCFRTVRST